MNGLGRTKRRRRQSRQRPTPCQGRSKGIPLGHDRPPVVGVTGFVRVAWNMWEPLEMILGFEDKGSVVSCFHSRRAAFEGATQRRHADRGQGC